MSPQIAVEKAQHLLDIYAALGVEWGEDPFARIAYLNQVGATGELPHGKLNSADEGELRVAIGGKGGNVVIAFGKNVSWLALDPAQAQNIAALILQQAHEILNGSQRR
jgi:hypothetical protein